LDLPQGHAVALSSGTASLFLSLHVMNSEGKKVAIPAYSCSALRNAVSLVNAKEIVVDTEINSPNICLKQLQKSEADFAIVPHMFGIPINLKQIKNINIIEDCAQSLGATIEGKKVGRQGRVGVFSFYATKLITSGGQGGMIVSKDKELIDSVRDYRNFDCRRDKRHRFNFQMTDVQAGIGRAQLKKLPSFLKKRRENFKMYKEAGIDLLESNKGISVYYRAIIRSNTPIEIHNKMQKNDIKTIIPIEEWELLESGTKFQNAYNLTQRTLSLPIYPSLKKAEINKVINILKEFT